MCCFYSMQSLIVKTNSFRSNLTIKMLLCQFMLPRFSEFVLLFSVSRFLTLQSPTLAVFLSLFHACSECTRTGEEMCGYREPQRLCIAQSRAPKQHRIQVSQLAGWRDERIQIKRERQKYEEVRDDIDRRMQRTIG